MSRQWYEVSQHHNLGYRLVFFMIKICPAVFVRFLAFPIGFFYFLFRKDTRSVSKKFLSKCFGRKARGSEVARHIISFALNLVENIQSWTGAFTIKDLSFSGDGASELIDNINNYKGTVILISHLGNAQMLKALASFRESGTKRKVSVTTISDVNVSGGFYSMLNEINPDYSFNQISTDDIGPDTILLLQERLEKGETVVIAGDRMSAHSGRSLTIPFLGEGANFPYGVYLLVALLNQPTYFVNGIRHKDFSLYPKYEMIIRKNQVDFDCGRKEREKRIELTAENYARNLESLAKLYPYQWYNFFDFW